MESSFNDEFTEVEIKGVRIHVPSGNPVIVLKDLGSPQHLLIWIAVLEANAIALALRGERGMRPLTHDLLLHSWNLLGCKLDKVAITKMEDDIFFARIYAHSMLETFEIDARPSDALALAAKTGMPVFVKKEVILENGVIPDDEEQEEIAPVQALTEADEKRLAPFKEMVNSMDLPDLEPPTPF